MDAEKFQKDSYWIAAVAEGDTGGIAFTFNGNKTQANFVSTAQKPAMVKNCF